MFFNMKIEVNKDQPLDEVVGELERLGYKKDFDMSNGNPRFIYTGHLGHYFIHKENLVTTFDCDTTLPELKEMKCNN